MHRSQAFRQRLEAAAGLIPLFVLAGILSAGIIVFIGYAAYARTLKSPEEAIAAAGGGTSIAYDRNGQQLYEYVDPVAGLRDPVPINQISPYLIAATVATEDSTFYSNPGVNISGLLRAGVENLTPFGSGGFLGGSGGSSITQQLVKNIYISQEDRISSNPAVEINRKFKETVLALELKRQYSDDQILDWYLNEIGYGNFAYGIQAASKQFFAKDAKDLTLAEAAYLAGLPQAPTTYQRYPDKAKARQGEVLDLMIKHLDDINAIPASDGSDQPLLTLTSDQIDAARSEPLNFTQASFDVQAPHFDFYVQGEVEKMCQAGQFDPPEGISCDKVVSDGGLRITTTLDLGLNKIAEQTVQDVITANEATTNGHDGALVSIDPKTGEILAYVGSRDYSDEAIQGNVDIATSLKSMGSTMKMFTYLTAFKQGWVPSTYVEDKPLTLDEGGPQAHVINNWNSAYLGKITVRTAFSQSVNTAAVRTVDDVGVDKMQDTAHEMGITDLNQTDCGPTITLGACEVKMLDQVYAFSVLANNGTMNGHPTVENLGDGYRKVDPVSVLKITDASGKELYNFDKPQSEKVVDPAYAYMVTDVLSNDAITWSNLTIGRPAATKTGTSENFRDDTVMGYTPNLTTGVWLGNADNTPMANGTFSAAGAGPMWTTFMKAAVDYLKLPADKFTKPDDITTSSCAGKQEIFKKDASTTEDGACTHNASNGSPSGTPSATPKGSETPTPTPRDGKTPKPTATSQGSGSATPGSSGGPQPSRTPVDKPTPTATAPVASPTGPPPSATSAGIIPLQ